MNSHMAWNNFKRRYIMARVQFGKGKLRNKIGISRLKLSLNICWSKEHACIILIGLLMPVNRDFTDRWDAGMPHVFRLVTKLWHHVHTRRYPGHGQVLTCGYIFCGTYRLSKLQILDCCPQVLKNWPHQTVIWPSSQCATGQLHSKSFPWILKRIMSFRYIQRQIMALSPTE